MKKLSFLILILCLGIIGFCGGCAPQKVKTAPKYTDLKYDEIQKMIVSEYGPKSPQNKVFCIYETIWQNTDKFYNRKCVIAYIEEIPPNLQRSYGKIFPVLMVYDLDKAKIVRTFAPQNEDYLFSQEILNQFPEELQTILRNTNNQPNDEMLSNMENEALNHAKKYYNFTEPKQEQTSEDDE